MIGREVTVFLFTTGAIFTSVSARGDEGTDFFENKIRPVLAAQCYSCHSAKLKSPMGGFYADSKEGMLLGGKSGAPAVVPGKPEDSLLIKAIEGKHKELKMPPGKTLPDDQVEAFVAWVKMGAPDPRTGGPAIVEKAAYDFAVEKKHWAYQPVRDPQPPAVDSPAWNHTPVDRFIKAKLDEKGLKPLPVAGKRELLRRVTYDLTGLPPTPAEFAAFSADTSANALEKVVDRLLASPRYGEHWGRHWLDVVRYSDTAGDASDFPVPEMYRYRNYVIRSIQQDKPFDQFVREQIAGDLMPHKDDEDRAEKLTATGYISNSRRFGQSDREFYLTIDDTIENLGKSILGLSTGCARCHDHKFDPIPTKDYYALAGIFKSTKYAWPGLEHHQYVDGFSALNTKDQEKLDKQQKLMVEAHGIVKKGIGKDDKTTVEERLKYFKAVADLGRIRQNWPDIPMIYAVHDEETPVNEHVMVKGDPKILGPEVQRGFLQILGGETVPKDYKGSGRELLAGWLTDAKNPLTARVMANRVWLWHFGRGLVNTPNDFGKRGELPTHPELLDYLASRFMENGWSLKKLHKEIILTRAYATASGYNEANLNKDPKNELYWRFDRRRLSAEEVRDTLLAASGQLDPVPGGPHPFPPRGSYVFTQHLPFVADVEKYGTNKRSVYMLQQRFRPNPFLELFDGADTNSTTAARVSNNTALQALYMMNDPFVEEQANELAARVSLAEETASARIKLAYQILYGRLPSPAETQLGLNYLRDAKREMDVISVAGDAKGRSAWTGLMRVLLSSNEFIYVD